MVFGLIFAIALYKSSESEKPALDSLFNSQKDKISIDN